MKVTVLYFAALRERIGRSREECELPAAVETVECAACVARSRAASPGPVPLPR